MHNKADILECIDFIKKYREFEKKPLPDGFNLITQVFYKDNASHLCDQWKWKKRSFGDWYLNLGTPAKIKVNNHFGFYDKADDDYIIKLAEQPMAVLFINPSNQTVRLKNLVLFFENHGICTKPFEHLELSVLPKDNGKDGKLNLRYGCSANWGKYILNLKEEEQLRVVSQIINNYQTDNYQ